MKKVFNLNRKWAGAYLFAIISTVCALGLLTLLAFEIKDRSWMFASFAFSVLVIVSVGVLISSMRIVKKIEIIDTSFVLHFFLIKPLKYQFEDVQQYATAAFGSGRAGLFHSVVIEFRDGKRFQVAYPVIENYKTFLEFMRNSTFEYYGYIGQNKWRRTRKPLSNKWVVAREEKDLEKDLDKKKGLNILYFVGIFMLIMNGVILRYFIVYA